MESNPQSNSPFRKAEPVRLGFGTLMLMLLTVVGAGVGLLLYYAMRVPAITSEINAWLGRSNPVAATADSRAAQVTFVLFVYTAPLALGMLVYFLHYVVNWIERRNRARQDANEEAFRMEP